jgi:periplasmic nitrate reductase NapE
LPLARSGETLDQDQGAGRPIAGCSESGLHSREGGMAEQAGPVGDAARRRRMEIFAFLFLTAVLIPALAVATVGGYGLTVWIYQMMTGPPGPPSK